VNRRQSVVILTALTALLAPVAIGGGAVGASGRAHGSDPVPTVPDIRTVNGPLKLDDDHIHGTDGQVYDRSPVAVRGKDGHLFFGADFDAACAQGDRFVQSMDALAKLARIIEKSGRTAVWTLGYNKSGVLRDELHRRSFPHGACDARGLASQARIVRNYSDPNYLPLADKLANSKRQTYFKTDPHWSSVGGAVFAKALASHLDRKLGKKQRYTYGSELWQGMLNDLQGIYAPETVQTAFPDTRVTSTTKTSSAEWSGYPSLIYDYSWRSTPARRTYPGKTLLLGDSFTMFALENMRPLFRNGHWMWYYHCDLDDVIDEIVASDTVVIQIYQLFTAGTTITAPTFLRKLRRALA
jgi:hypothetical protein